MRFATKGTGQRHNSKHVMYPVASIESPPFRRSTEGETTVVTRLLFMLVQKMLGNGESLIFTTRGPSRSAERKLRASQVLYLPQPFQERHQLQAVLESHLTPVKRHHPQKVRHHGPRRIIGRRDGSDSQQKCAIGLSVTLFGDRQSGGGPQAAAKAVSLILMRCLWPPTVRSCAKRALKLWH